MASKIIDSFERIDDLNLDGLKIIQDKNQFCFGVDAVLLSHFAAEGIKKDAKVLDLCCGNGIIPLLLSHKSKAKHICGVEIQKCAADLAERSVRLNNLNGKISIFCDDLKNAPKLFGMSSYNNITCNPPYKEIGSGIKNKDSALSIARHEILCNLEDIIVASAKLLMPGGKLALIHRPERLCDIFWHMRKNKIEPKRLKMVYPSYQKAATMVLVEGTYCGRPKLLCEKPIYVHKPNSLEYTDEIDKIYEKI